MDSDTIDSAPQTDLIIGEDGLARPAWAATDPLLRDYYDTEWGNEVRGETALFERLSLEVFQSGLSWATILRKRPAFREAFRGFDPDAVANFGDEDVARLLADATIVRNRRKIEATIANARATIALRSGEDDDNSQGSESDEGRPNSGDTGGLAALIWSFAPAEPYAPRALSEIPSQSPESVGLAKELRARGFRHVGPVTMFALMEAVGIVNTHLVGSHRRPRSEN